MNLTHLTYFLTLADLKNYTQAAEKLSITQPTLSQAIKSLEEELGVPLFERKGRTTQLTVYGESFQKDVSQALNQLEKGVDHLDRLRQGSGHMRLAALRQLSREVLPKLIRQYIDTNTSANITFEINSFTGMSESILQALMEEEVDVAFCTKLDQYEDYVQFIPFAEQQMVVVVPENHPLADQTSMSLDETLNYPQVGFSEKSGVATTIEELYEPLGRQPHYLYKVEEDETVAGLVAQGFGIAILPDFPSLSLMQVKRLAIADDVKPRICYMAFLKGQKQLPVIENFIQFVKDNGMIMM